MKKILSVILIFCLLISVIPMSFALEGKIKIDGTYTVVPDENLAVAATKFAGYLNKITGENVTVKTAFDGGNHIRVHTDKEMKDGYKIYTENRNVSVVGSSVQWSVRGMYDFLEKYGGVHMYTSKLTVYKNTEIEIPADLNISYTPYFEYCDTDWLSPRDTEYSLFNGLNGSTYRSIPSEFGGTVEYISSFCHTLTNQFCDSGKYYADHPEYYALYRGVRTDSQLCLSNPDVLEIVKKEVFDLLKSRHDPDAQLQIISLTQDDNIFFCTCPKCHKTDLKYGSHAGTVLEFVNSIARDVKSAGYDNVALDTFAYRYTRTPPTGIKPEDNVIIRLCSIECCFSHTLDDKTCETNLDFMNDLEGWSKICNRIYIWDYCTNYSNFAGIFPDFGTLQRNIQIFYEHNVKGVYEEGNYTMKAECEFGELRSYLISRFYKNPYDDYTSVRNEFTKAYYGKAAKYINEFLDIITENASGSHLGIYAHMMNTLDLSNKEVKYCDKLWENASSVTSGDEYGHVKASELCWRWWKRGNFKSEFSNPLTYKEQSEKLVNDIRNSGTETLMEVDEFRSFLNSVFNYLYFDVYFILRTILRILYSIYF